MFMPPKDSFHSIFKCMTAIAEKYQKNIIDILMILEKDIEFEGIREWFNQTGAILHPFPKGNRIAFPSSDEKRARDELQSFSVLLTGARKGDMLIGLRTQSKNSIIQLFYADVPPDHRTLDTLRSFDEIWIQFLNKLNTIPYFSKLSQFEKELYLEYAQRIEDIYLDDVEGLKIKVLDIGESTEGGFLQLPPSDVEYLSQSEPLFVNEITERFPKKPGSTGLKGRHTLIFRRGLWKIYFEGEEVDFFNGLVIDAYEGIILKSTKKKLREKLILFENIPKKYSGVKQEIVETQTICIKITSIPQQSFSSEREKLLSCINRVLNHHAIPAITSETLEKIISYFELYSFTPAGYKSLLQKIIRFGPRDNVEFFSEKIYPPVLLLVTIGVLFLHPGSFVPDIQRYVTGMESAFKRTVVTLLEDSYVLEGSLKGLVTCILSAFLGQRLRSWKPELPYLEKCFNIALEGYFSLKAFVWDIKKGLEMPRLVIEPNSTSLQIVSSMLDELRSFSGDLALARYLAYEQVNYGKLSYTTTSFENIPHSMPIEHCIDQHWAPEIAYLYSEKTIKENLSVGNSPFSKLFIRIFSEVTGINPFRPPRKGITMNVGSYDTSFEEREFVKETRKAQRSVLFSKNKIEPSHDLDTTPNTFSLTYSFGPEWIAGMIGVIEVPSTKKGPTALVTLAPSHLQTTEVSCTLVAIRKPFREMKDPFLSDERTEEAISYVKNLLQEGIIIKDDSIPLPFLKGAICKWDEESSNFFFLVDKVWKNWESVLLNGKEEIPFIKNPPIISFDISELSEKAFSITSKGIYPNPSEKMEEIVSSSTISTISRLIGYLSNKSIIQFKRIGRDGGGSKDIVIAEDVYAYQLFLKIYLLFPFAFSRKKSSALDFYVKNKACVLFIIERLQHTISKKNRMEIDDVYYNYGGNVGDTSARVLWEHQIEAIDQLKENIKKGRKGSFLWLPVGSGKTMIVLEYLLSKIKNKTMMPYVIYTLPSSAMQSIIHEIESYHFPYTILIPLKNAKKYSFPQEHIKKDCVPLMNHINLIELDHLRLCEDTLSEYVKDSIFIIDEVHKALNETKRTATALQFSHLSREFIALTGTPIIDSNTYKLVWWLEQIVPFEVTQNNFWVTANDMISRKFVTGVIVRHDSIYMKMSYQEEQLYKKLVPNALGGINEHPRPSDFQKAMELCYTISNRGMIETIREMLQEKRGVFVVAKDIKHQEELFQLLVTQLIVPPEHIFLITGSSSIFLTDEAVETKKVPDYKVVITTVRKSAGYTLTRLSAMVTSVYPSNNADREQLEGRINRIGQKSPDVIISTIHCGILTYILTKHMDAKNLSAVLSALASDIKS